MEKRVDERSLSGEKSGAVDLGEKETKINSREPLFGALLLGAIALFFLLTAAGIGWAIWGGVEKAEESRNELSISALGEITSETASEAGDVISDAVPVPLESDNTNSAVTDSTTSKTTAISVLNGGAAGGSAGRLAEAIKQDGYTQVTAGDSTGDYTGVVIYHSEAAATEAANLKQVVAKTYPNVTTAQAIASNAETSRAPLTVIIGR